FFSSRRRHTRSKRDWSSDVCSSDLVAKPARDARGISQVTPHNLRSLWQLARNNDLTSVVSLFDITGWLEVLDIECIPCIRESYGSSAALALRSTLFRHLNSLLK